MRRIAVALVLCSAALVAASVGLAVVQRDTARARQDEEFASLLDEVVARRLDPASAASTILERFDAGEAA